MPTLNIRHLFAGDPEPAKGNTRKSIAFGAILGVVMTLAVTRPTPTPGPAPQPHPAPAPAPDPAPIPPIVKPIATGVLHATMILDAERPNTEYAAIARVLTGGLLSPYNVVPRYYYSNQTAVFDLGLEPILSDGLPVLIFQDLQPGETVAPVLSKIPATSTDAMIAEARRLRGVK